MFISFYYSLHKMSKCSFLIQLNINTGGAISIAYINIDIRQV